MLDLRRRKVCWALVLHKSERANIQRGVLREVNKDNEDYLHPLFQVHQPKGLDSRDKEQHPKGQERHSRQVPFQDPIGH